MLRKRALLLLAAVAVFAAAPASAADSGLKIFGGMTYISPLSESEVDFGTVRDSLEASSEMGWTVGLEWRFGKLFGLEVDYIDAKQDVEFGGTTIGEVGFKPLSASLNFHILPAKHFDLYVAPTASWVNWGNIELNNNAGGGSVSTDSEFAYGAQVGLDFGFEHLKFMGAVRWLSLDISGDGGSAGVDPLIARLAVGWKF